MPVEEAIRVHPRFSVAQIGARRDYAVPCALQGAAVLSCLYTDFCVNGTLLELVGRAIPSWCKVGPPGRLLTRQVPGVPSARMQRFPRFALLKAFRSGGVQSKDARIGRWVELNRRFCGLVRRHLTGDRADGFYVFNGAGLEILTYCRERGLCGVLDQTIAPISYEQQLLDEERDRWPQWFFGQGTHSAEAEELSKRERQEWKLADRIICGSEFVRSAVDAEGGPREKCAVVHYGLREPGKVSLAHDRSGHRPLHVLFAGTITPRKGIQYLLSAAKRLGTKRFEFRAVGPLSIPEKAARELKSHVAVRRAVPRSAMSDQYAWADVLVHPTLCEGSANVCYEALGSGVPVVTTPNAGSVVRDGLDGFIVPIRDPDAIAIKLEMLRRHQQLRVQMSRSAVDRASKFTWDDYAGRLLSVLIGGRTSAGDP